MKLNDEMQVLSRQQLIANYKLSVAKKVKVVKVFRSIKLLQRNFTAFEKIWDESQAVKNSSE